MVAGCDCLAGIAAAFGEKVAAAKRIVDVNNNSTCLIVSFGFRNKDDNHIKKYYLLSLKINSSESE